jgi:2-oxoglutarate dehydrogenase E2 component (dihydrolipoamide succinyltransferase)
VNEEDTVNVGQEIARLELGEAPAEGQKQAEPKEEKSVPAEESPSEPAKDSKPDGPASSAGSQHQEEPSAPKEKAQTPSTTSAASAEAPRQASPPKQETKPQPKPQAKDEKSQVAAKESPLGKREERRVSYISPRNRDLKLMVVQVKMNRMRLRIAERLKQSQNTAASLTTFNEVDMSSIMDFRKLYKDDILKTRGVKLGFMSAFSRACILAMREVPAVNASIEGANGGDTIVYRDYVDISVAVATPKGLVTPVVRNAESLDMVGIEEAIAELGKKVWTRIGHAFGRGRLIQP